jgi:glutamine---fructose-6-phosphate transaminase (isomerizing)
LRDSSPNATEAFRQAVNQFEGSVAIAYSSADQPDKMYLALHGSGQGMCIGLAEDRYVVASEPYGVVEETPYFIRMDGEALADSSRPSSRGQIIVLSASDAGRLDGIDMLSYEGDTLPLTSGDVQQPKSPLATLTGAILRISLLKEISEAPTSFRKTLRGRIGQAGDYLVPELDHTTLPESIIEKLRNGTIKRVRIIGQGTAAIAGRSMVSVLDALTDGELQIDAMTATELSGFAMYADMSDMLIVAVSQSGTTTDTNRTVDLVASRGASVLAIVNRRGSELAKKAHGVYYTSDGRDIEMSVASTKAFMHKLQQEWCCRVPLRAPWANQ